MIVFIENHFLALWKGFSSLLIKLRRLSESFRMICQPFCRLPLDNLGISPSLLATLLVEKTISAVLTALLLSTLILDSRWALKISVLQKVTVPSSNSSLYSDFESLDFRPLNNFSITNSTKTSTNCHTLRQVKFL